MDESDMNGGPFMEYLGLKITDATPERVTATWTAHERHHQPMGLVHGGVHASVVETLGSVGAWTWLTAQGREGACVGVNNNTDFYRATRTGDLLSVATPIHQGRSQQVWLVETRDADDRLVARGQLRVQNLR